MKIAFFYRTRDEYDEVVTYINALNLEKQTLPRFRNKTLLYMHTRYLSNNTLTGPEWNSKIPKRVPGTKKYIGVIVGNCHTMKICGVNPEEFLQELGREIVPKIAGVSKYDGEKTAHPAAIKTHQEFRTITSVFNKRYGHGNWRIQGPKRLQQKLREIQPSDPNTFYFGSSDRDRLLKKYPNGIPVTLIVHEANANIPKQLFKAVLKG